MPKGGEVITTPFTFASTTHAIVRNGLVPVFCDIKEDDYTIDTQKLENLITDNTVAIVPVHVYGNMCDVEEIDRIAKKYGLKVVYDAAHAFAVKYKGESSACFGDASMFSFHATKVFNTIEGGCVCFKNDAWVQLLNDMKNFGIHGPESVQFVGGNAKMNEFQAAMGICNLKHKLPIIIAFFWAFISVAELLCGYHNARYYRLLFLLLILLLYAHYIICHGSPSPKLWREYAESIQRKDGKITYLTFKDKRNGWKSPTAYVKVNGTEKPIKDYVKVFYNRCALRPSCYECPYATTKRKTDMTIGDFWHIEETIPDFYDPNGNSLFLIHTNRGEELFEKIKGALDCRLSNTTQCWQANLEAPTKKSEQREEFWGDYQKKGIDFVVKKYGTVPMKTRIKNKLLKIMGGYTESSTCYADYSERRAA